MGSKSLAQIPARRNGPVSYNVRPHRCNSQAHQGHVNSPPNPHRDLAAHPRSKSSLPNARPNLQFCATRLATTILPQVTGLYSPRRFCQGEARVGNKTSKRRSAVIYTARPVGQFVVGALRRRAAPRSQFIGAAFGNIGCTRSFGAGRSLTRTSSQEFSFFCPPTAFAFQGLSLRPNPALNRTYCGGPAFGLQKPSPNASPPQ